MVDVREFREGHVSALSARPIVSAFFEKRTCSVQYVVVDPETRRCAVIDPVLDYEPKSGATATRSADALLEHVKREGYVVEWILDTHPHAGAGASWTAEGVARRL